MSKEEILSEYFLVESEKTDDVKGWKVIGTIEGCASQSLFPIIELKTDGEGWLCDFKIKLLGCGIILASPEYVIEEDELVMEAMEKIWNEWGISSQVNDILNQKVIKDWEKLVQPYVNEPYTYNPATLPNTWTTSPNTWSTSITNATNGYYTDTITCSANDDVITATTATSALSSFADTYCTAYSSTASDYVTS